MCCGVRNLPLAAARTWDWNWAGLALRLAPARAYAGVCVSPGCARLPAYPRLSVRGLGLCLTFSLARTRAGVGLALSLGLCVRGLADVCVSLCHSHLCLRESGSVRLHVDGRDLSPTSPLTPCACIGRGLCITQCISPVSYTHLTLPTIA